MLCDNILKIFIFFIGSGSFLVEIAGVWKWGVPVTCEMQLYQRQLFLREV